MSPMAEIALFGLRRNLADRDPVRRNGLMPRRSALSSSRQIAPSRYRLGRVACRKRPTASGLVHWPKTDMAAALTDVGSSSMSGPIVDVSPVAAFGKSGRVAGIAE